MVFISCWYREVFLSYPSFKSEKLYFNSWISANNPGLTTNFNLSSVGKVQPMIDCQQVTDSHLRHPFWCDNSKSFTAIKLILGIYSFRIGVQGAQGLFVLEMRPWFWRWPGHKCKIWFLEHNSTSIRAINLKPGTDQSLSQLCVLASFGRPI